jgi:hypothetical protein
MNPTAKKSLFALIWFALGHLSCAAMHHMQQMSMSGGSS